MLRRRLPYPEGGDKVQPSPAAERQASAANANHSIPQKDLYNRPLPNGQPILPRPGK